MQVKRNRVRLCDKSEAHVGDQDLLGKADARDAQRDGVPGHLLARQSPAVSHTVPQRAHAVSAAEPEDGVAEPVLGGGAMQQRLKGASRHAYSEEHRCSQREDKAHHRGVPQRASLHVEAAKGLGEEAGGRSKGSVAKKHKQRREEWRDPHMLDVLACSGAGEEAPHHQQCAGAPPLGRGRGACAALGHDGARKRDRRLGPYDLVVVDKALLKACLAVGEVEAPLPEEDVIVLRPQSLDIILCRQPVVVPHLERRRIVEPDVLHVVEAQ
mmetsp:Transcript_25158/g.48996  ORF Transcript_25158/g.48996 Transcript_25158/m.48996 type:complete len:269 (-) Transcript_25158:2327-3133(-)